MVDYQVATPTILYHFSPSCSWCERNWENVRTLIRETRGRYRFVGISTTPVSAAFMHEHQLDFEVADSVIQVISRSRRARGLIPKWRRWRDRNKLVTMNLKG